MLSFLHKLALRLIWIKPVCIVVAVLGVLATAVAVFIDTPFWQSALEPSVVMTLWGMMLYAFVQLFRAVPEPAQPNDKFFRKLTAWIKRFLYSVLAVLVIVLTLTLLWLSVRLLLT